MVFIISLFNCLSLLECLPLLYLIITCKSLLTWINLHTMNTYWGWCILCFLRQGERQCCLLCEQFPDTSPKAAACWSFVLQSISSQGESLLFSILPMLLNWSITHWKRILQALVQAPCAVSCLLLCMPAYTPILPEVALGHLSSPMCFKETLHVPACVRELARAPLAITWISNTV